MNTVQYIFLAGSLFSLSKKIMINWYSVGVSAAIGGGVGSLFFKPYILPYQYVTSWAAAGTTPILSGKWVMMGEKSWLNQSLSVTRSSHNGFPAYPLNNFTTGIVPDSHLSYPNGWESIKGVFGQRIMK